MAFNFNELKTYFIDYSILENFYSSLPILSNTHLQTQYIKSWLTKLEQSEKMLNNAMDSPEKIRNHSNKVQKLNEIWAFQQLHNVSKQEIIIHFRISLLNKIIDEYKIFEQSTKISINKLTVNNSRYLWTPQKISDDYPVNPRPILIVPYFQGQYNGLVIDGNHRLTTAVANSNESIDALFFTEGSIIEQKIFSSHFDMLFYIFNNELNHIYIKRMHENLTDTELLNLSYLNGEKFKFQEF